MLLTFDGLDSRWLNEEVDPDADFDNEYDGFNPADAANRQAARNQHAAELEQEMEHGAIHDVEVVEEEAAHYELREKLITHFTIVAHDLHQIKRLS
jgi:hypothetical protein